MEKYIKNDKLQVLILDMRQKLINGQTEECIQDLDTIISEMWNQQSDIDREYLEKVKARKRGHEISDIDRMLQEMSLEQLHNVREYVSNEYDEPNHEAKALAAIISLSKSYQT